MMSGGVTQHTRTFRRDSSGQLVMTVRESTMAVLIGVMGGSASGTSYVRWTAVPASGAQPIAPAR
jgi:hypothetical protein